MDVYAGEQDVILRTGELMHLNDLYDFAPGGRYVIIAYGAFSPLNNNQPLMLMIHPDENVDETEEDTFIRFANVIPDGDAYGFVVTTEGGWSLLFPRQDVGTISEYKHGPVYTNTFELIPARNTSLPAVFSWEDNLQLGTLYTFIATGRVGNGTVEVFAVTDAQALRN